MSVSAATQKRKEREEMKKEVRKEIENETQNESIDIENSDGTLYAKVIDILGPAHMRPVISNGVWKGTEQISEMNGQEEEPQKEDPAIKAKQKRADQIKKQVRQYELQVVDATPFVGGDLKKGDKMSYAAMTQKLDDYEQYESEVWKPMFEREGSKKIVKIICIANDITDKVKLENKANLEHEKAQRFTAIIERPMEFVDLMSDSEEIIEYFLINLNESTPEEIFRSFHTLKARFSSFKANETVQEIHDIESILSNPEFKFNQESINLINQKINNRKLSELKNNEVAHILEIFEDKE